MTRKKFISLAAAFFLCIVGCLSLAACDGSESEKKENPSEISVDIDLTKLSSTMVYSEVYNMLFSPDEYIGKTVKMSGKFVVMVGGDNYYPAVLVADALACCSQGFEFLLKDKSYPKDYPETLTEIVVVGRFDTYYEGSAKYCHLVDAELC